MSATDRAVRREGLLRGIITTSMTIGIETMGMTGARGTNLAMKTYNPLPTTSAVA